MTGIAFPVLDSVSREISAAFHLPPRFCDPLPGTYELDGQEAYTAVTWALEAGYRHIDSATWYENERECGKAILDFCASTGTPRSAIFYTTKLKINAGYEATLKAIEFSLKECGLGYIDLYLIHGPLGGATARKECWRAICDAQKTGQLKSIGISTFGVRHIQEILDMGLVVPAVNQIDLHPFMTRTKIVDLCRKHRISLEAWAPLVRGLRFKHPAITKLSGKYKKEPAQILLRYSLQKNYVAIPKSSSRTRITSNLNIFDFALEESEVAELDGLDEELVTDWDPTDCP
ncbi:Aldo-ket-red domain-containing protein [Mycena kentingensis (nom. inval.)]|nr:Aldo-ket-red domain-containing protein [Mycena kentingensis (nom. inval.)]